MQADFVTFSYKASCILQTAPPTPSKARTLRFLLLWPVLMSEKCCVPGVAVIWGRFCELHMGGMAGPGWRSEGPVQGRDAGDLPQPGVVGWVKSLSLSGTSSFSVSVWPLVRFNGISCKLKSMTNRGPLWHLHRAALKAELFAFFTEPVGSFSNILLPIHRASHYQACGDL